MIKFKRLSLIDKKQPQELYCSTYDCLNEIAKFHPLFYILSDDAVQLSDHYCFDCVLERCKNV